MCEYGSRLEGGILCPVTVEPGHTCYNSSLLDGYSVKHSGAVSHLEVSPIQKSQEGCCFQCGVTPHHQLRNVHICDDNITLISVFDVCFQAGFSPAGRLIKARF